MDEFEKLEQELAYFYDLYILKFRCLVYLEQQMEDIEKSEYDQLRVWNLSSPVFLIPCCILSIDRQCLNCERILSLGIPFILIEKHICILQKREESIRGMITTGAGKSLFEEEKYERGSDSSKESDVEENEVIATKSKAQASAAPAATRRSLTGKIAVHGAASQSQEQDDSLDSDIDLDGEDDASDLDSEEELELMNLSSKTTSKDNKSRPATTTAVKKATDSDDDF